MDIVLYIITNKLTLAYRNYNLLNNSHINKFYMLEYLVQAEIYHNINLIIVTSNKSLPYSDQWVISPDSINYLDWLLGRSRSNKISAVTDESQIQIKIARSSTYRWRNLDSRFKYTTFRSDQTACEWNDLLVCSAT